MSKYHTRIVNRDKRGRHENFFNHGWTQMNTDCRTMLPRNQPFFDRQTRRTARWRSPALSRSLPAREWFPKCRFRISGRILVRSAKAMPATMLPPHGSNEPGKSLRCSTELNALLGQAHDRVCRPGRTQAIAGFRPPQPLIPHWLRVAPPFPPWSPLPGNGRLRHKRQPVSR